MLLFWHVFSEKKNLEPFGLPVDEVPDPENVRVGKKSGIRYSFSLTPSRSLMSGSLRTSNSTKNNPDEVISVGQKKETRLGEAAGATTLDGDKVEESGRVDAQEQIRLRIKERKKRRKKLQRQFRAEAKRKKTCQNRSKEREIQLCPG